MPEFLKSARWWVSWVVAVGAGVALTVWFVTSSPSALVVILLGGLGLAGMAGMTAEMRSGGSAD